MSNVIELDRHDVISVDEALELARRAEFSHVVVLGIPRGKKQIRVFESGDDYVKNTWLAQRGAHIMLDNS